MHPNVRIEQLRDSNLKFLFFIFWEAIYDKPSIHILIRNNFRLQQQHKASNATLLAGSTTTLLQYPSQSPPQVMMAPTLLSHDVHLIFVLP